MRKEWGEVETILMKFPDRRNTLNAKQLHILKLTYKFRFITAPLLTQYKAMKSRHSMYMTLERLAAQNYLMKRTDNNKDFSNRGTRYGLAPEGFKVLQEHGFQKELFHTMYSNKRVTEGFVDHLIDTMRVYLYINTTYPETFEIFTRTELASYEAFPSPRPDLYMRHIETNAEYFLELFHDAPPKNARKRLDDLLEHYDQEGWEQDNYPTLLFVLADGRTEGYFTEYAKKVLDNTGMEDEITVLTTTMKALSTSNPNIWSSVVEPEKLTNLNNL
jgi:hypothetical protein